MLQFRPTRLEDLDVIFRIERDPENIHWICPYTRQRHIQVIESDDEFHFVLEDEKEKIIGYVILAITEKEDDSIEFRRIALKVKGKGYGRQAVRWIKEWAFGEKHAHRLWLDVFQDNKRALKLYRSEGFKEEGMKRESIQSDKGRRSQIFMSVLRHEYK